MTMLFDDQQFASATVPTDYEVMLANRCLEIMNDPDYSRVFPQPTEDDPNPYVKINEILEFVSDSGSHGNDAQHNRAHALKDLLVERLKASENYQYTIRHLTATGEDLEPVVRSKDWQIAFLEDYLLREFIGYQENSVEYVRFKISKEYDLQRRNTLLDNPKFLIWCIDEAIKLTVISDMHIALENWREFKEEE